MNGWMVGYILMLATRAIPILLFLVLAIVLWIVQD